MPIYQNKALQDQMMRVATQGQQRSINDKARQAAVAKAIGATGQVAAKAYSANSEEVMRQAKELGLSSPEEVAGLKKVMEASERTGLSIEEIMNSDKMMAQLQKEAVAMRDKKSSLDESLGELKEMRDVQKGKAEELQSLRDMKTRTGKDLTLPYMGADKKLEGIDSRIGQTKRQIADNTMSKEKLAQMAKLQALDDLGISGDGLTAARRSVSAKQKLDKLASSNLVGRDMVGRMASEGSREGMKELTAQRLAAAKARGGSTKDAISAMNSIAKTIQFDPNVSPEEQAVRFQSTVAEVGTSFGLNPAQAGQLAGALVTARANEMAGVKYGNRVKETLQKNKSLLTKENIAYTQGKQDDRQNKSLKQQREEGKLDREARNEAAKAGRVFPPSNRANLINKTSQLKFSQTREQADAEAQQQRRGSGKTQDGLSKSAKDLIDAAANTESSMAMSQAKKTAGGILGMIFQRVDNEGPSYITAGTTNAAIRMRAVQAAAVEGNAVAQDILDSIRRNPAPSSIRREGGTIKKSSDQKRANDAMFK